jgi:outer membrane protein OmpA-like peptidoglycan-associated protein
VWRDRFGDPAERLVEPPRHHLAKPARQAGAWQREQIAALERDRRTLSEDREQLRGKLQKINSALDETRQQMAVFQSHQQTLSQETERLRNELAGREQELSEMKQEMEAVSVALQQAHSDRAAATAQATEPAPAASSELAGLETPAGARAPQPATSTLPPGLSRGDDSDADGVSDSIDLCLETQSGVKVDAMGCALDASITLEGVNFRYDSWELTRAARAVLDRVADILVQYPRLELEVAGHTDAQGDRAYNRWLSEQRAKAVRDYLIAKNLNQASISARGYGSEQPIADNSTREGLLKNRRVELRRLR